MTSDTRLPDGVVFEVLAWPGYLYQVVRIGGQHYFKNGRQRRFIHPRRFPQVMDDMRLLAASQYALRDSEELP